MKVHELMSKPAVHCRESDSLQIAVGLMKDRDCGSLPVISDDDRIIGMITDRDICMAAHSKRRRLSELTVAEITKGHVYSVGPNDSVQLAEQAMSDHQVRRLPVVDADDRVLGMLSINDIAREGLREQSLTKKDVRSEDVMKTLAAICEPNGHHRRHIL